MEMDALLEAVITEPLEKIIEIFPNNISNDKMFLDYEILNRSLEFGRMEIADYFLNTNCRVNRSDKEHRHSNTPLHHAVILRDIDLVKRILKKNGSVVAKNADGDTPLHLAFINQEIDIVDTILKYIQSFKSEINYKNIKNKYGCSHMHIACVRNQVDLVKLYLDNGEDVNHAIYENSSVHAGFTSLHFAVKIGSECIDTIQLLLSHGAKPFLEDASSISAYDINEDRVLDDSVIQYMLTESYQEKCLPLFHMACLEGNEDYMDRFLEMGVNVNRPLSKKLAFFPSYTPLHCAVLSGEASRVKKLLFYGADVNLCEGNMSPIHLALYMEKPSASRREDTVLDTLFAGLSDPCVNKKDPHGLSYFHVAVTRNKVDLVRQYLERGYGRVDDKVQRNQRNFSNFAPLHFGVMYGCLEVVGLLLEAKASVNCNDDYVHGTPLHMAMEKGNLRMAHLLLDHGADANARLQDTRRTPLHLLVLNVLKRPYQLVTENIFAVEDAEIEAIVKRLVLLGCDVNLQDIDGNTPLHIACSKIRITSNCVQSLLRWGANLDIENNNDKTPFENSFLDTYRCNAQDYMVLFHHVKKLQYLGLWIHENNIACCKRLLTETDKCDPNAECFTKDKLQHLQELCIHEVEDLKATKLLLRTSLYHVIWDDVDSLKSRARTSRLQQILEAMKPILDAENFDLKFPCYGFFVRLWYYLARRYAPEPNSVKTPVPVKARRKQGIYKKSSTRKTSKNVNTKREVKSVNSKREVKSVISKKEVEAVNSMKEVETAQ